MKPFAARFLGVLRGNGEEAFPNTLTARPVCHQGVFDERVYLAVPDHVDEADQALVIARCDPPQAQARERVSPIVFNVSMIEALRVELTDFFVSNCSAPFKGDRHAEKHYRREPADPPRVFEDVAVNSAFWRRARGRLQVGVGAYCSQMPNLSMTIRPAVSDDADGVWRLVEDFSPTFRPEREAFDLTFRSLAQASQTLVLVAEQDSGSVVGYLLAHCRATFLANGPAAWVEEVMVAEPARRKGVGQALMNDVETCAKSQGAADVSLASRRAGDFYLSLEYEDAATFFKKPLNSQ
jgi:predicted N-acetyltransferase YhbS